MRKYCVVFRCNETVVNQKRVQPLSNPALTSVSSDYIPFYQRSADNVPEDERVLPIPENTPIIVEMFRKATAVSKPPKRIRYDKKLSSCLSNTKKRRRRINGFLGFKLYYARILPPLEPKVKSDLLVNAWGEYEYQRMWEQYTAQYRRYPRSIGFVDWLLHVPKYTVQEVQQEFAGQPQNRPETAEEEFALPESGFSLLTEMPLQRRQHASDNVEQDLYPNIGQPGIEPAFDSNNFILEQSPLSDTVDGSVHSDGSPSHWVSDTGYFELSNSSSTTPISVAPRICAETGLFPFDEASWENNFVFPSFDNESGLDDLLEFDNLIHDFMGESNSKAEEALSCAPGFSDGFGLEGNI